jgi:hypothetical protein
LKKKNDYATLVIFSIAVATTYCSMLTGVHFIIKKFILKNRKLPFVSDLKTNWMMPGIF